MKEKVSDKLVVTRPSICKQSRKKKEKKCEGAAGRRKPEQKFKNLDRRKNNTGEGEEGKDGITHKDSSSRRSICSNNNWAQKKSDLERVGTERRKGTIQKKGD